MVVRVAMLHDLIIPSDLPHHEPVVKPPSPPGNGGKNGSRAQSTTSSSSSSAFTSAASQIQRVRALRHSHSQAATPTLSPLSLQSPKQISKIPRPAAGGGRAVAFALRNAATGAGNGKVVAGHAPSMRVVRIEQHGGGGGGLGAAATLYGGGGSGTPGSMLRARPRLHLPTNAGRLHGSHAASLRKQQRALVQPPGYYGSIARAASSNPIACAWR